MGTTKRKRRTQKLEYPDVFFCQAAEGWLELGNIQEATVELERISAVAHAHPEVLYVQWRILAKGSQWDRCLIVARIMAHKHPADSRSWIALAETFYALGEFQKAYKVAAANAAEFPESWSLQYDAACYACLVGCFEEAKEFFELALMAGDPKTIRSKASKDPNLEALWRDAWLSAV